MDEILQRLTEVSIRQQQITEHLAARQGQTEQGLDELHTAAARRIPLPDPQSKIVPVEEGLFQSNRIVPVPVAQWLEHCVSKHKGCGFDFQGTNILTIQMYSLNALSRFG